MLNTDNKTALLIYLNEVEFLTGNLYELINNDRPMPEELKDVIKNLALALYDMVRDIYFLIVPAAREVLTGSILELKNTFDAATDAIADIDPMTDVTLVQAYDEVNTPNWP